MNDSETLVKTIKDLQRRIERLEKRPSNYTKAELLDILFPVGAYYVSRAGQSPATWLGGSWNQLTTLNAFGLFQRLA